ncbi:carboxypeptidase regulatory-like domain-containing protein [Bacillus sp. FJAT-45350]|uniref:carboxypeptidase regulatory-like domain-containing protein n=1 Tax=Bacillus sp. FJAT-45350 TaxID=2011014 RepID=UPI000BB8643C|nr:S-layer homology domain-containing protein [Bacillus sp. FJAT-45350]
MSYQPKSYRKFLAASLSAAMVATVAAPMMPTQVAAAGTNFADVKEGQFYTEAVTKMAQAEFIQGFSATEFGTNSDLLRRDAAVLFSRILEWDVNSVDASSFTDVQTDRYYHNAVAKAAEVGLIRGKTETTFAPADKLTRGEMAVLLTRAFNLEVDQTVEVPLTDIAGHAYENEIKAVYQAGLTTGYPNGTFQAGNTVTRAEFATFLFREASVQEKVEARIGTDVITPEVVEITAVANNNNTVTVTGEVTNADKVEITLNNETKEVEVNEEGKFEYTSEALPVGAYTVSVVAYNNGVASETKTTNVAVVSAETGVAGFVALEGTDNDGFKVSVDGKEAVTNSDGYFAIGGITAGEHTVTISKAGYATKEVKVKVLDEKATGVVINDLVSLSQSNIEVSSVVVDSVTGAAVEGADVKFEVYNEEDGVWEELTSTTTNATGAYEINNESGSILDFNDKLRLQISKELSSDNLDEVYHSTEWIEFDIPADQVEIGLDGVELVPVEELTFAGSILDGTTEIDGATIEFLDGEGNELFTVNSNSDGEFEVEELTLPTGEYFVRVDFEGDVSSPFAIYTTVLNVTEGQDIDNSINLVKGFDVEATIGAEGVAATIRNGATVTAELVKNGVVVDTDEVTPNSAVASVQFDFDRIPAGEYKVRVSGEYVQVKEFDLTVRNQTAVNTIEGNVALAGTISGAVTAAGDNATVRLMQNGEVVDSVRTTGDTFTFTSLPVGDYNLEVSQRGFVTKTVERVTVTRNNQATPTAISLTAVSTTASVEGYVRTQGSLAAANDATVTYYALAVQDGNEAVDAGTIMKEEDVTAGKYTMNDLLPGTYQVVVRDGGNHETFVTTITVAAGDERKNVNYLLEKGGEASLELELVDEDGNELDASDLAVTYSIYDAYADSSDGSEDVALVTGSTTGDSLTFNNLAAGTYTVKLSADGYNDVTRQITVTKNEERTVQVSFTTVAANPAYNVNVRVVNAETNANFENATVVAFDKDGEIVEMDTTSGTGQVTLELTRGTYTLAVIENGHIVAKQEVTVNNRNVNAQLVQLVEVK